MQIYRGHKVEKQKGKTSLTKTNSLKFVILGDVPVCQLSQRKV